MLIKKMKANGHVRDGVINFNQLTYNELRSDIASPLRSAGLVPTTGDVIDRIQALRTEALTATNEARLKELKKVDAWWKFNTDIAANMALFTQIGISSMEAASGVISVSTGAPSLDLRKFRSSPKVVSTVKAIRTYKIGELSKAMLTGLNATGKTLSAEEASGINFLGQSDPDAVNLSDNQFSALNNMLLVMIDIAKDSIKTKNFSKVAQAFGPALTLYNLNQDCSIFSDECFADALALLESVSEALHLGTRVSGSLQLLRTTMDAYIAGKEYAQVTTNVVVNDQAKILENFDHFEKRQQIFWLLTELSAVGLDNLFEAYDPSIPCPSGATRYYGACVGPTPTITDLTFTASTANTTAKLTAVFSTDMQSGYSTTGSYVLKAGKEGYWPDKRTFVVEFDSYTSGGQITLVASGFKSVSGQPLAADRVYTFPQDHGLAGTFKVSAVSETGKLFAAPSTASSCTFTASGVWDSTSAYITGANGIGAITNVPLYDTWNWRLFSAPFMSLIASQGGVGNYVLIGNSATLNVASNKNFYFLANDGIGAHFDNGGELTVNYTCQ